MGFDFTNILFLIRVENMTDFMESFWSAGADYSAACKTRACHCPSGLCQHCDIIAVCGWYLVFAQEVAPDPDAQKRHQKPPLPFAFSFTEPDAANDSHKIVDLRLAVAGNCIQYVDMLVDGLTDILNKDEFLRSCRLLEIAALDFYDMRQAVSGKNGSHSIVNLPILSSDWVIENCFSTCSQLQITLLSPLRLISLERQIRSFDFSVFACSIMRRISSIAYYYGEHDFDVDFKALSQKASEAICVDYKFSLDYASRASNRLNGIVGTGVFQGDLAGLLPFIQLGTYFNVGKKAAFGMGRFSVVS